MVDETIPDSSARPVPCGHALAYNPDGNTRYFGCELPEGHDGAHETHDRLYAVTGHGGDDGGYYADLTITWKSAGG